jgi:tRNA A-37 threonylcarbamoyl transferase component Bud32
MRNSIAFCFQSFVLLGQEGYVESPTVRSMPLWFLAFLMLAFLGVVSIAVVVSVILLKRSRPRAVRRPRTAPFPVSEAGQPGAISVTGLRRCPECGSDMPEDAPEGLCPQCLLRGAISSVHDASPPGSDETAGYVPPSTAPSVEEVARLLPHLEVLGLLGQGGMGAVYKARQPSLDRLVAVKVLAPEAARDPAFAERFAREARALARLNHPNIVAIHDIGRAGELCYIVMEHVDGVTLRQLLSGGHLTPQQALSIVPQLCDALQYAHEEGIVHRDIKPENILFDRKGRVKIADFGLAKLLDRTSSLSLTGSKQVMGTLYYMAPEQMENSKDVDHRADIYSLGVVFYEMLTGQLPVGRFPMPSEKAGTDAYLDEVVLRTLEREPARRYQRASKVKTEVQSVVRKAIPSPARRTGSDSSDEEINLARRQLQGPAIGLAAASALGFVICALGSWITLRYHDRLSDDALSWLGFAAGSLVGGGLLTIGAWKMWRLEAYEFVLITCILALLPVTTVAYPVSLLMGIWALMLIRKPEIRNAFARRLRRPTQR